jgi:hypothetical protein
VTFFKEHIIQDPKKVLIDYNFFSLCEEVHVVIETKDSGWNTTEAFPTKGTLKYLSALKKMPIEFSSNPTARTISEYNFGSNSFYILPNMAFIAERDWVLFLTPEIRKHIVNQLKQYKKLNVLASQLQSDRSQISL